MRFNYCILFLRNLFIATIIFWILFSILSYLNLIIHPLPISKNVRKSQELNFLSHGIITGRTIYQSSVNSHSNTSHNDFGLFLNVNGNDAVILKEYGLGCLSHFYLNDLDIEKDLREFGYSDYNLIIIIDGYNEYIFEYNELYILNSTSVFKPYLSYTRTAFMGGLSVFGRLCFKKSIEIIHRSKYKSFDKNIMNLTFICSTSNSWFKCPLKLYFSSSLFMLPQLLNAQLLDRHNFNRLKIPSNIESKHFRTCNLSCHHIASQKFYLLEKKYQRTILNTFFIRIIPKTWSVGNFDYIAWLNTLLSIETDGKLYVSNISVAKLFGYESDNLVLHKNILSNLVKLKCYINNQFEHDQLIEDVTGFFEIQIPFMKSIKIILQNLNKFDVELCTDFEFVRMNHMIESINYLTIKEITYSNENYLNGRKSLIDITNTSGHFIGSIVVLKNSHIDVEEMDISIFVDGTKTASIATSSTEDYYGCSHHCNFQACNSDGLLNGCLRNYGLSYNPKKIIDRTYYRSHFLDPIVFNHQINVVVEGISNFNIIEPYYIMNESTHSASYVSFILFLYTRPYSLLKNISSIYFINNGMLSMNSTNVHSLRNLINITENRCTNIKIFKSTYYYGIGSNIFGAFNGFCCKLLPSKNFSLTFKFVIQKTNRFILRRTSYSRELLNWNEEAIIFVDNTKFRIFIQRGSLENSYNLRQSDIEFILESKYRSILVMIIQPITKYWCDISYDLIGFVI